MSGFRWGNRAAARSKTAIPFAPLGRSRVAAQVEWACCYGDISKAERKKRDEALVRAARARREPERP